MHEDLVSSLYNSLKTGGRAFISFSHHQPPGNEGKDLKFIEIAERRGLEISTIDARSCESMWNADKEATILFYELIKK